jgi:hypothetical protein
MTFSLLQNRIWTNQWSNTRAMRHILHRSLQEPGVTLSPLMYHYQHRAEVEVIVQTGDERDVRFDRLIGRIAAAVSADRTLRGLCDWVEAEAPEPVDLPVEGGAAIKAAVVPVILHYATSDALGGAEV